MSAASPRRRQPTPGPSGRPLTPRQAAFVAAFLARGPAYLNASAAAREAGYRWPAKQGFQVIWAPRVRAAVEAGFRRLCDEASV